MVYWFLKKVLEVFTRIFWVREVTGAENVPQKGAYILAANHTSYLDFISLIAVLNRRIYFLAAEKFYKSIFWYPWVVLTGQIRVDRKSQDKSEVFKKVFSVLEKREVLGIFPEGTRSGDGKIGKTFTGVAKIALFAKVPVIPIGISGAFEIWPRQKKFPKLKKNIVIKIGRPMYFNEFYDKVNDEKVLREITDKIMSEIKKLILD